MISPGFFDGEPAEVREVFTDLRALFLDANDAIAEGRIPKNHAGRIVDSDALHGYINYTCKSPFSNMFPLIEAEFAPVGNCISEEQAEIEMDKVEQSVLHICGFAADCWCLCFVC